MKIFKIILLSMVFILLLILACSKEPTPPQKDVPFRLKDINGQEFNLADYQGKVVVAEFFSIDCEVCTQEIPQYKTLYNEYKNKDVKLVAVSIGGHHLTQVKGYISTHGLPYTVLIDDGSLTGGIRISQSDDYFVTETPTLFLIDKNNKIRLKQVGRLQMETNRTQIDTLLAE